MTTKLKRRIVLIDLYISGHHLTYIKLFALVLNQLQYKIDILLPVQAKKSKEFLYALNSKPGISLFYFNEVVLKPAKGRFSGRKNIIERWSAISSLVFAELKESGSIDLVFFPYLDPFLGPYITAYEIDSIFPYKWTGLYFNPQNCRKKWRYSIFRKWIFSPNQILKSDNCKAIGVLDFKSAAILLKEIGKPIITIPDIADDSGPDLEYEQVAIIKARANGRKIVTLIGSLDKRKGVLPFIEACLLLKNRDVFFLLAGRINDSSFSSDELSFIVNSSKLVAENSYFYLENTPDESKFNALIYTSDILCASYYDFPNSSNLIRKAALYSKPIIVSKGYYMEELINKYNLGISIDQGDPELLAETIRKVCNEDYLRNYEVMKQTKLFLKEFSFGSFISRLNDILFYYQ